MSAGLIWVEDLSTDIVAGRLVLRFKSGIDTLSVTLTPQQGAKLQFRIGEKVSKILANSGDVLRFPKKKRARR